MAFKPIEPIGAVDPKDHLYTPLWVVFGSFPQAPELRVVCLNEGHAMGGINLWGYSHWSGKAAYRTDGINLNVWIERNTSEKFAPAFFTHQALALDYIRRLTEPRCEALSRR